MPKHFVSKVAAILILFTFQSKAEVHYTLDGRIRSLPQSTNLVGTAAWDSILWGQNQNENPFYGFYRIGGRLGGSPTAAAFVQVAPIAPLVFEAQKSWTYRWVQSKSFNCDKVECLGNIDRTDYSIKAAGAYRQWVLLASVLFREIRTPDSAGSVVLENESLQVPAGTHQFHESFVLLAYKMPNNQLIGAIYNRGEVSKQKVDFQVTYGIYQFQWQDLSWTAAVGSYDSTHESLRGTSVVFAAAKTWGESLSLF